MINKQTRKDEFNLATESPDRKSMGTSIEVQTANSTEVFSFEGEKKGICHRIQHRTRTQAIKQKVQQKTMMHCEVLALHDFG